MFTCEFFSSSFSWGQRGSKVRPSAYGLGIQNIERSVNNPIGRIPLMALASPPPPPRLTCATFRGPSPFQQPTPPPHNIPSAASPQSFPGPAQAPSLLHPPLDSPSLKSGS